MAQASSIQREPSMEEILASIRRIIEDNEAGRQDPQADDRRSDEPAAELSSFRPELKPANLQQPSPFDSGEVKESAALPFSEQRGGTAEKEEFFKERHHASQESETPGAAAAEAAEEDASAVETIRHSPSVFRHEAVEDSAPRLPDTPHSAEPPAAGRRAIVSEEPGRKVAAAFGELNEALLEMRRQSLDQVVEEMLRPMLQDWLDNNLPQLVERLVREEIERIARGG